jgi:hypothetical protein
LGSDLGVENLQFSRVLPIFIPKVSKRFIVEAQKLRGEDDVDRSVGGAGNRSDRKGRKGFKLRSAGLEVSLIDQFSNFGIKMSFFLARKIQE